MERGQDIVLGALFALLGLGAAWVASSYSGATGGYPLTLGLGLTICGIAILGRAVFSSQNEVRPLFGAPGPLLIALVAAVLYVALIVPLGFFTSSALLMLALPAALGFRRPVYIGLVAAIFIALVWAVFTLLLNKPLPTEFFLTLMRSA